MAWRLDPDQCRISRGAESGDCLAVQAPGWATRAGVLGCPASTSVRAVPRRAPRSAGWPGSGAFRRPGRHLSARREPLTMMGLSLIIWLACSLPVAMLIGYCALSEE